MQIHWAIEQHYFITELNSEEFNYCNSLTYFCENCGRIWGRITNTTNKHTSLIHRCCENCTPLSALTWGQLPGSTILDSYECTINKKLGCITTLPNVLLCRELLLHTKDLK